MSDASKQWKRIGRYDEARRRSLWVRLTNDTSLIELRAGREGDDYYVAIRRQEMNHETFDTLRNLFEYLVWALEDQDG